MRRLIAKWISFIPFLLLLITCSGLWSLSEAQMRAAGTDTSKTRPDSSAAIGAPSQARTEAADTSAAGQTRVVVPPGAGEQIWDLDRVAAIVNESVILLSEVQEQTYFQASQRGISLADSAAFAAAQSQVLQRLIEEKVIVDEARKRGMTVPRDDIEKAVDGVVQDMIRGTGSEGAFRAQLEREGLTEEELRALYRPQLEAQILATRLVRREVNMDAEVAEADIEAYYNENQETFPERPETVRLSHIYVSVLPDSTAYVQARETAEGIRARIMEGEDFETLAMELSADPSARKGGDLGFFKKGQLDPRFEEVVFSLEPGQLAEVVQTRFGFHVIKLIELRGEEARARHILVPVVPTSLALEKAKAKMDSVKAALDSGADFAELAAAESEDAETRDLGGDLGYYAGADLTPDVRDVILALKPGEMSDVAEAPDGLHIFLMTEHKPKGRFTMEETKEDIREFIRREKLEEGYAKWIDELKREAYIVVKGG